MSQIVKTDVVWEFCFTDVLFEFMRHKIFCHWPEHGSTVFSPCRTASKDRSGVLIYWNPIFLFILLVCISIGNHNDLKKTLC